MSLQSEKKFYINDNSKNNYGLIEKNNEIINFILDNIDKLNKKCNFYEKQCENVPNMINLIQEFMKTQVFK